MGPSRASSSYLVRETVIAAHRLIRVQNLRTGEIVEFTDWRGFVRYVTAQRRLGTLK